MDEYVKEAASFINNKKIGLQSIAFNLCPVVVSWASMVGPMEGQGPFGNEFDWIMEDYLFGEDNWEKAESKILRETIRLAVRKRGWREEDVEVILAGDFLNQVFSCHNSSYEINVPVLGIYGACSTLVEGLILGAMLVDGGFYKRAAVGAVSHHHASINRYGLTMVPGKQRIPSAQWVVTGAGAALICDSGNGAKITFATVGKIVDIRGTGVNDIGDAMAPAAADTIIRHFRELGRRPEDYDLIITGDLGKLGSGLLEEMCAVSGYELGDRYVDCGVIIYDPKQNVQAGGSGCGCLAAMTCGPFFNRMAAGKVRKMLLVGTGAFLNHDARVQGESVPGIAHAVVLET